MYEPSTYVIVIYFLIYLLMYKKTIVHSYVRSFITSRLLHYLERFNFHYQCDVTVSNPTWEMVISNVINWPIGVTVELSALLKSASIEGFMKGIILFWWSWRCTIHPGVIWIVSLESVLIFFMINNWEVIYLCLFAFNFSNSVLILLFNVL